MITALVIFRIATRPHRHVEALTPRYVYIVLATLLVAEVTMMMMSYRVITPTFLAIYGSGILSNHFPDPAAAWLNFQDQKWDVIGLGTLTIMLSILIPGTMGLGNARKAHLDSREKAIVALIGVGSAVAGWIAAVAITTIAIALQQNHDGTQILTTVIAFAITITVVAITTMKAAKHWDNGTGGGTGRRYQDLKAQIKSTMEKAKPSTARPQPSQQP